MGPLTDNIAAGAADAPRIAAESMGIPEEKSLFTSGIVLRLMPPGTFAMGSPESEHCRNSDERQHTVALTRPYYIGKYLVTQAQWKKVMGTSPTSFSDAGDDAPVQNVSWFDCQEFLKTLCTLESLPEGAIRLPTEAEWEYTCRAGTQTPFSCGDDIDTATANFDGTVPYASDMRGKCRGTTVSAGRFPPNPWGLYDMHGNVWEWCNDWYGSYTGDATDPAGPTWGTYRVIRGGCWEDNPGRCRSAARDYRDPGNTGTVCGFRIVMLATPKRQPTATAPKATPASVPASLAATTVIPTQPAATAAPAATYVPVFSSGGSDRKALPVTGIELLLISPGAFDMGSPDSEKGRNPDETRHTVTLTRPFYLGMYPVTQAQWSKVMDRNPSHFKLNHPEDAPVEGVSWDDCCEFMKKLAALEDMSESMLRFPTEAEWEYACRAGTQTAFYCGDDFDSTMANFDAKSPYGNGVAGESLRKTVSVGQFAPNPFGLYDMHGNVCEWCADWHGEYAGDATDPCGPEAGKKRVIRGGAWCLPAARCRSAYRDGYPQGSTNFATGFRLCMDAAD